jgi:penicillin-binding protein 1B
LASVEKELQ